MKRLFLFTVLVALLFSVTPSVASPIIIGSPADVGRGNGMPFGAAYAGEYQQVYTSGAFSGAMTITGLQFYNTALDSGAQFLNSGSWTISLSTSARDWNTLSTVYADNVGADSTLVFSGNLFQPWAFGNTLDIQFATPFWYDPAQGNLLMDVFVTGASDLGGDVYFDISGRTSVNTTMGRVYTTSGWEKAEYGYGLVTGFDTPASPIPEPASLLLLGTGLVGVAGRAWRKRRG
jgi:hypothetical protein